MSIAPQLPQPSPSAASRRLLAASLLAALLLLTHAAFMATERHAAVMGATHALHSGMVTTLAMADGAHRIVAGAGDYQTPTTILGDCPAQQAIPPLLLLVLLALVLNRSVVGSPSSFHRPRRNSPAPLPPPLSPQQRRAFLQVFLI